MFQKLRPYLVFLLLSVLLSGCSSNTAKAIRIVVIPKGTTHQFWLAIWAGALTAAKKHDDVEIVWQGPVQEDKHQEQLKLIERFVGEDVSAIVLAPSDRQLLKPRVASALKAGIPVVIIDSGLEYSDRIHKHKKYLGYVATDNEEGGRRAAQHLKLLLKNKKKARVLMIPYQKGSQSTELREKGFRAEMSKAENIELIISKEYAGATVGSAQQTAERQLSLHKNIDGIFTPNESSTEGMLQALGKTAGLVKFVGFDSSKRLIKALEDGKIHGLVLQHPFDMGYKAVERAIAYIKGTPPPQEKLTLHTALTVATKDNLTDSKIQAMYQPDLSLTKK